MGLDDGGDFWSGQRSGGPAEKKVAACKAEDPPTSAASSVFSGDITEQVLMGDWNLFVAMAQHMDFSGFTAPSSSGACVQANEWISASGGSLTEQVTGLPGFNDGDISQRLPGFNDGDISQLMSSSALSANGQIAGPLCAADLNAGGGHGDAKDSKGKKRRKMPEHDASGSQSPISRIQSEQKKEVISGSAKSPIEDNVKKEKDEHKPRAGTHKLTSKQAKESSSKGDADKEDYIHLRAKRGHATNSHSLAERVRRQKISERMKFLQDLVPGCNKITGKAVMLDEIINYIQSLQHQVEFLSMKLATVNPEVNLGVDKIVSKEIFYSQTGGSNALGGFCPGFISSHPPSRRSVEQGAMQVEMAIHNNPNSREERKSTRIISPLPELYHLSSQISNIWQGGLQNVTQVSCIHSGHLDARTDPPGSTKTDKSMTHERNVGAHG